VCGLKEAIQERIEISDKEVIEPINVPKVGTVTHKSARPVKKDSTKWPYRLTVCDDEYEFIVVEDYWKFVTCKVCRLKMPRRSKGRHKNKRREFQEKVISENT